MKKYTVGVVGIGFVGSAVVELFNRAGYNVRMHDKFKAFTGNATHEEINECDVVFVSVPTPMKEDKTCDLSAIQEVLDWCTAQTIVIKSTVPVGTTQYLRENTGKHIVHNPEFLREATAIDDMINANRTVLGGEKKDCLKVAQLYQTVYNHDMVYVFTSSDMSEFVKYATNTFFATKVSLINELAEIGHVLGLDYNEFREIWLLDPRIGRHHTLVTAQRGFGGTCLPKDLNALIHTAEANDYDPRLLKQVWNTNCDIREEFYGRQYPNE